MWTGSRWCTRTLIWPERSSGRCSTTHSMTKSVSHLITFFSKIPPKVANPNVCTNELFPRCATNLAAEATSQRSTTKWTRRLGLVRKRSHFWILSFPHIFVLLFIIFLSGNEKTEKDLWDVIPPVLTVIEYILCCIINCNTANNWFFYFFLALFLYYFIFFFFLKMHFNVWSLQITLTLLPF